MERCPACYCEHQGQCEPTITYTLPAQTCPECGCRNCLVTDFGPEELFDCRPMCQTED